MGPDQKLEEDLSRIKKWWDMNNLYGAKRYMWTIYHSNNKAAKGRKLMQNNDQTDPEQAADMLLEALATFSRGADKYITVVVYTGKSDPAPIQMDFINPFYESGLINSNMPMVSGQGSVIQNGYSKTDLDKLVEERVSLMKDMYEKEVLAAKKEMEYQKMLEDMQGQIEGIANSQQTMLEKAMGMLENPTVSGLLTGILGKFMQGSEPTKEEPKTNPSMEQSTTNMYGPVQDEELEAEGFSEQDIEEGKIIEHSVLTLDDVFEGEGVEVLAEISALAEKNPNILKALRVQMQQILKQNGQGQ